MQTGTGKATEMTSWSVTLEVHVPGDDETLIDAADAYLDILSRHSDVLGPVTAVNLSDRVLRSSFDLDAGDFETVARRAADLGVSVLADAGVMDAIILHAEITSEPVAGHVDVAVAV